MTKVIKASAGTGKTYRLSLEYIANLLQGEDFENIVVMTFTRKATAEIRERILEHLAAIIKEPQTSEVAVNLKEVYPELELDVASLKIIYQEMISNKDQIKIYTIDSFVNTIFKQAIAPYLNIYDYQIIDSSSNQEIVEAVFKRILDNKNYFEQMEEFLSDNLERDIETYINLLQKIINNRWKFLLFDFEAPAEIKNNNLVDQFNYCVDILEKIAQEKGNDYGKSYFRKAFRDCYAKEGQAKKEWLIDNYKLCIKKHFWNGNKTRGKSVKDLKEVMSEEYEQFKRDLAAEIYNREMFDYQQQIIDFAQQVFDIYDRIKFQKQEFTHADISNYTYQYLYCRELDLLEGTEISSYFFELLGTKVNSLLIDEFQDTSVLQWKILLPLIEQAKQVITVGDEKQSIYSWRGGEKELFANLEEILAGTSETLSTSYRSQKNIVEFINRFFSGIHPDWSYEAVDYLKDNNKGYVEVLVGGNSKHAISTHTNKFKKKSEAEQQRIEKFNQQLNNNLPQEIAATIQEKVDDYAQVGVLARRNDDLKRIAEELDKLGIPYILESQDSLIEHQAVAPIYYLSKYLAYGDYLELIKFLRSELVAIDGKDLKYLLRNQGQVEQYLNGEEVVVPKNNLQEILLFIRNLADLDFDLLANYLLDNLGVVDRYADNSNALKNIYQYFQLMKDFDYLINFMSYIEENKDSSELKQVGLNDVDAVKLMTIHKAKGLSFTTEFFYWNITSNRGYRGNNLEFYYQLDEQFAEVEDYLLTNSKYNQLLDYLGFDFYEQKQHREFMEEINNVYVALTRAADNLFLYIDVPKKFDYDWQVEEWKGKDYQIYEQAILQGIQADYLKDLITEKSLGEFKENSEARKEVQVNLKGIDKYFAAAAGSVETGFEQKNERLDLEQEEKRLQGLAVHYYLENIKYNKVEERELARKLVGAKFGNIIGRNKLEEVFRRAEAFLAENKQYFADKWEVFTEYEVSSANQSYRIDRLLVDQEEKKIIILDYKTGVSRDKKQLARYQRILAKQLRTEYEIETAFLEV